MVKTVNGKVNSSASKRLPSTLDGLQQRVARVEADVSLFTPEGPEMSATAVGNRVAKGVAKRVIHRTIGGAAHAGAAVARRRETAESMAAKQKEIAVSEFFAKNRHLLGFDNPRKALLTSV